MDIIVHILQRPFPAIMLVSLLLSIILFFVVLFHQKRESVALSWFTLLLALSGIWAFAQLSCTVTEGSWYMFWYAVTELMVVLIMPVIVIFVLAVVGKEEKQKKLSFIIPVLMLSGILLFLYWKTDLIVIHDYHHMVMTAWGAQLPRKPIPWDAGIIFAFSLYSVFELIAYYLREKNAEKRISVGIIACAALLPIFGGIMFQAVYPAITGTPEIPAASPLIIVMCLIIGYVLLRRGWSAFSFNDVTSDILQIIPGSIVIVDTSHIIQNANKSFLELVGKKEEDVVGKPFVSIVCDEAGGAFWKKEVFDAVQNGSDVTSLNATINGSGGKQIPVTVRATIKRNSNREFSNIFLVLTDVTALKEKEQEALDIMKRTQGQNTLLEDNKRAMLNLLEDARLLEDNLKDERDRVTAILNNMSEGLCVVDKNGKIVSINPVACSLLGVDGSYLKGKQYAETIILYKANQPVSDINVRPLLQTLKTGESFSGGLEENYAYKRPDGKFIPIAWATVALKRGEEIVGAITTFHDISKDLAVKETIEKKVEERTRELSEKNTALEQAQKQVSEGWIQQQREKARLTASINSLSLGFILTDMEDHIITMNPASQGIIGLSSRPEDLKVIEGLLQGVVDLHKLHEQCHAEQKPIHIESVLFGRKYLRIFLAPIVLFTSQEEHLGTVILIEDVSEAKTLERSREEFFSIASHELRTPLTAIRGNTSLIKEHYFEKLEPDLKEMVDDIHESSVRLINIVNDFLNSSRLEQQRLEFKNQPFDLPDLIQQAIKEYQVTSSRQKLSLDFEVPPTQMPAVFADPERVRQVIINLVGNGMKFTEEGGIKITMSQMDNMVEVLVSDTGRGIAIQNQALLFHKFQQAGDSLFTRDTTKGTGLGLYISKLMIEAMGGKIWLVKSEPNKGSTFAFTLPIAKKPGDGVNIPASNVVQNTPPV
jgi:PAS domain S-box-containing protein